MTADANYAHFWILKKVLDTGASFCFRISKSTQFVKDFIASGKKDVVLSWCPSKSSAASCKKNGVDSDPITIRLVRIDLKKETEILVTSLIETNKYSYQQIKELYNARWATEEEFKKFMQRLVIEFFSSIKINGIMQDFYANVFMQNLVSIFAHTPNEQVYSKSKKLKYRRQINWTSALGDVHKKLTLLFLRTSRRVENIIESLFESFKANTQAIIPGRKFKRDKRKRGHVKKHLYVINQPFIRNKINFQQLISVAKLPFWKRYAQERGIDTNNNALIF